MSEQPYEGPEHCPGTVKSRQWSKQDCQWVRWMGQWDVVSGGLFTKGSVVSRDSGVMLARRMPTADGNAGVMRGWCEILTNDSLQGPEPKIHVLFEY